MDHAKMPVGILFYIILGCTVLVIFTYVDVGENFGWVQLVQKSNAIELSHTNFWVRLCSTNIKLIEPNHLNKSSNSSTSYIGFYTIK